MTCQHNRICPFTLCSRYRATNGFDRLPKIDSPRKFARKPERHPGRRDPNDRKLDPCDFLQNERPNFRKRMVSIGKFACRLSLQYRVRSQHRHCRSLQCLVKGFDSPIKFVIANDPGVVTKMIKQIDHQFPFVPQTDLCALIYVADIDQNRVWILPSPAPNLRSATREPAAISN